MKRIPTYADSHGLRQPDIKSFELKVVEPRRRQIDALDSLSVPRLGSLRRSSPDSSLATRTAIVIGFERCNSMALLSPTMFTVLSAPILPTRSQRCALSPHLKLDHPRKLLFVNAPMVNLISFARIAAK